MDPNQNHVERHGELRGCVPLEFAKNQQNPIVVVGVGAEPRLSFKINDHPRRGISLSRSLSHSPSHYLSLPHGTVSSRSRSDRPETIPHTGLRRLTRHTALRMTCGRWTNAIGSKGAPAFPPPYAPPSILVRLKRRFQSSYSGRAHAHAFAASTAAPRRAAPPGVCVCVCVRHPSDPSRNPPRSPSRPSPRDFHPQLSPVGVVAIYLARSSSIFFSIPIRPYDPVDSPTFSPSEFTPEKSV